MNWGQGVKMNEYLNEPSSENFSSVFLNWGGGFDPKVGRETVLIEVCYPTRAKHELIFA